MNLISLSECLLYVACALCVAMASPVPARSSAGHSSATGTGTGNTSSPTGTGSASKKHHHSPKRHHHHHKPKWVDPCGLTDSYTYFDPVTTFAAVGHNVPTVKLFNAVIAPTRKAKQHAERVKQRFVSAINQL